MPLGPAVISFDFPPVEIVSRVLDQEGFDAFGIIGSSGFKSEWMSLLESFETYITLDNNEAGRRGVDKMGRTLTDAGWSFYVLRLPEGVNDVNDFFCSHRPGDFVELISLSEEQVADFTRTARRLLNRLSDRSDPSSYGGVFERLKSMRKSHSWNRPRRACISGIA